MENGWEQVIVQRVLSCPVVVFVGLGSPAATLKERASQAATLGCLWVA